MARKKAQETEGKKVVTEADVKPVSGGTKAAKSNAKTATSGAKSAKKSAKTTKSAQKAELSGAKQSKNVVNSTETKRKTTKIARAEHAADNPTKLTRKPRGKAADNSAVSGDSNASDMAQGKSSAASEPAEIIYSLKAGAQIFVKTADIVAATGKSTAWIRQD